MRIVVDVQAYHTISRSRGIGRYARQLTRALIEAAPEHEFFLVLDGRFPQAVKEVRRDFADLAPPERIRAWQTPIVSKSATAQQGPWKMRAAEAVREHFIAGLEPDVVLVTSLFEGVSGQSATSVHVLPNGAPTVVILYDLTPLRMPNLYLRNDDSRSDYRESLRSLKRADLALSISDSTRRDGLDLLGLDPGKVVNIGAGADALFTRFEADAEEISAIRASLDAPQGYVFYYGGFDLHKNVARLIEAYALLPKEMRQAAPLLLSGSTDAGAVDPLRQKIVDCGLGPDEVRFIGRVPDEKIRRIIGAASLVVFPSLWEGFGLPVLEAMQVGAPVLCSNVSSMPEVIGRADATFDPQDVKAIADKMLQVLTDDDYRAELVRHGLEQAQQFSWERSARTALSAMEALGPRPAPAHERKRLAWIADRSAYLMSDAITALDAFYDIDVIGDLPADIVTLGSALAVPRGAVAPSLSKYERIVLDGATWPEGLGDHAFARLRAGEDDEEPGGSHEIATLPAPPSSGEGLSEWAQASCARIERAWRGPASSLVATRALARILPANCPQSFIEQAACALAANVHGKGGRLLVDVTGRAHAGTGGIARVVERILFWIEKLPPASRPVVPVEFSEDRRRMFLSPGDGSAPTVEIEPGAGDMFLGLGLNHKLGEQPRLAQRFRELGGTLHGVVFDLLPLRRPDWFDADVSKLHEGWLLSLADWDHLLCISRDVADDLEAWLGERLSREQMPRISWFHLGAELPISAPPRLFPEFGGRASILHVSQVYRRKGHEQTLTAFEALWAKGRDVNYVVVGRTGYGMDEFISRMRAHKEFNRRLFWFESPPDLTLAQLYDIAVGVIVPSEAEGFGLPVAEAVRFRRPLLCRDLPVFREIIGDGARYFSGLAPQDLADAMELWLDELAAGEAVLADESRILSWRDSAGRLLESLGLTPVEGEVA